MHLLSVQECQTALLLKRWRRQLNASSGSGLVLGMATLSQATMIKSKAVQLKNKTM